jgi:hypothetical protein
MAHSFRSFSQEIEVPSSITSPPQPWVAVAHASDAENTRDEPRGNTGVLRGRNINLARPNRSAQSDQQDLIGEMKTNRQEQPARGPGVLLGAGAHPQRPVVEQRSDECVERRGERITDGAARGKEGACGLVAVVQPVMRVARPNTRTVRALAIRMRSPPIRRRITLAILGVPMVRAAAHHQVNHKTRGDHDAAQLGHATPYLTLDRQQRSSFAIFSAAPADNHWFGRPFKFPILRRISRASQAHRSCAPPLGGSLLWRLSDNRFPSSDVVAARRSRKASR